MALTRTLLFICVALTGCASRQLPPNDSSPSAHRYEPPRPMAGATTAGTASDQSATASAPPSERTGVAADDSKEIVPPPPRLNPASEEKEHVGEHARAATALEKFEDVECSFIPPRTRSACPLLGPIAHTEKIRDGVRYSLKPGTDAMALVARMKCHLAFARVRNFQGIAVCPLYIAGVEIRLGADGASVEVVSRNPAVRAELHAHQGIAAAP